MSLNQILAIFIARWRLMAAIFLLVVVGTIVLSLLLPKKYTASTTLLVDVKSPDPIAGTVLPGLMSPTYMSTQADVVQSDRVALRVVKTLKLDQNPAMRAEWQESTKGVGNYEMWVAETVRQNLDVKPSRESNVITISYKSVDPRFSAALANAFAQSYIEMTLEMRVEPARQYSGFFDDRAKQLRERYEQAQAKLSAFQKEKGIVATEERLDIETARMGELSSQLVGLQAISAESSSRQTQARNSADTLQDVINNPVVAALKSDIARQEARLQEMNSRMGDGHPLVAELKANIAELRVRLEQEMRRVGTSVGVNNAINQSREAQVRASLEAQRAKVMRLKEVRDEASLLTRDVENAQRAYDGVTARANLSSLESHTTQTNLAVISPATEPTRHSSPRTMLNAVLSLFVGALLAACTALLLEMRDRRARSVEDLTVTLELPLLGVLPRPHSGRGVLSVFGHLWRRRSADKRASWRGLRGMLPRSA